MFQVLIKKALPHIIATGIFLLLNIVYFFPQFQGMAVAQGDMVSHAGMFKEIKDQQKLNDEEIFWTNSMFSGMPSYMIGGVSSNEFLGYLQKPLTFFFNAPAGLFILAMLSTYIAFLSFGVSPWISIIGAILFGFTTNNFVLWEAGHVTKLYTLAYSGLVLAGFNLVVLKKNYILGMVLFGLGLGLNIRSNHIQMTYYLAMIMSIYYIAMVIDAFRKQYLPDLIKGSMFLLVGLLLAVGSNVTTLWKNYSYAKDTMRGEPILKSVANTVATSSSETEGLAWDYAMQWSGGLMDVMTAFIPGLVGGGSAEIVGTDAAIYRDLKSKGANIGREFKAPLYWGELPFTSGPTYFGAVLFLLFLLGAIIVDSSHKWWLLLGIIMTVFLSMGKHFSIFNEFLFNNLPFYSKFRSPNSILGVTALFVTILGILGLSKVVKAETKSSLIKPLSIATGLAAAFCLFFILLGGSFFDFSSSGDARLEQSGYSIAALVADRKNLMLNDSLRTLCFVLLTAGLIYAHIKDKIKMPILLLGIGLLTTIDLWTVGKRYLSTSEFKKVSSVKAQAAQLRQVDQQIFNAENIAVAQNGPEYTFTPSGNSLGRGGYRVFDLSINTFNSSSTSYFHSTIGGYHPAKLQRYQDIIEHHISKNNQKVLNMLNTKYFITRDQQLQRNPEALGTVWFVDNVIKVNTPNEELDALNSFDPSNDAVILDTEFDDYIGNFDPVKQGTIQQTSYHPNRLTYTSNSNSEQLAVFSEIWYDKGWKVKIDGEPAKHVRANYLLRALRIPAGKHTIEFYFEPDEYYTVAKISNASSIALILLFILALIYSIYEWWKKGEFDKIQPVVEKKELVKIVSKKQTARKKTKRKERK